MSQFIFTTAVKCKGKIRAAGSGVDLTDTGGRFEDGTTLSKDEADAIRHLLAPSAFASHVSTGTEIPVGADSETYEELQPMEEMDDAETKKKKKPKK